MEYHSFVDSEGRYLGKTKYIKDEFIPLPPEGANEGVKYLNHKWICMLPKIDETEEGYIKFNLNLDRLDNLNNTLLQLEVFCKKNKIESELVIKEAQFNKFKTEQQKQIIQSIINHGFKDIVFINGNTPISQIKCRNYFTYNYNTKKREYNKIYFRRNVNYSFDDNANVIVSKGVDYNLLNDCLYNIKKKHDDYFLEIDFAAQYIGCNAKCWYCLQKQSQNPELITHDKNIVPAIKKALDRVIELIKKEKIKKFRFTFLGGELTILDYDIQDELVEIINELVDKGYENLILSNGILKDAPLLHTKASYLIHVIDWKNKKLEKKENVRYIIIFTEKDSIEDLEKFKKLNKDIPIDIVMNLTAPQNLLKNFYNKERNQMHKVRDKKHKIYLCRYNNYRSVGIIFYSSSKTYVYVGCCGSKALSNDKIDTLNTTDIKKCPKTCIYAYNK